MLFRKLVRTALKYKAQFISMIVMVALGVGVFVGFNIEWNSIGENTQSYFEKTDFADYRIYSEGGFSSEDVDKVKAIAGVDGATRWLAVGADVKNTEKSLALNVVENYGISSFLVIDGEGYDKDSDGMWFSDQFAEKNGISVGDFLTLSYKNAEIGARVVGLVKASEYMVCVADDNQIMPDYSSYGYAFVSPEAMKAALGGYEFYPQIYIKSSLEKTEMEEKINDALGKTTLVLSKDENMAYMSAQSEMEEGQTMGSVLPVLFLLIALLTMVTTMHRITANEKTQIGTLKALGFRDRRILRHYTSYGFVIGLVGTVIGIALGYGIAAVIISPQGAMATYFDLPEWKLVMPWFCYPVIVGIVLFLTLIGFLSVKRMLKGTAAEALLPYVPKKMKKTALEKTRLWDKMSFGTKWNLRDIFRHKSRSAMTLIGVIGCMILLVGGLGMRDTVTGFTELLYQDITNYKSRINLTETASNEDAVAIAEQYEGDMLASSSIQYKGRTVALEIYDISHDKMRFADEDNHLIELGDEGAYICIRMANEGVKVGDTISFSPYGSDRSYEVRVAGIIRSMMTESITMTRSYAESAGIEYHIGAVFTDAAPEEIAQNEAIAGKQTKQAIVDSFDSFLEVMDMMIFILVLAAVVLGLVVLYNLGTMSYTERYRELATLKVVGFRDKQIGKLLISQNIWLTVIGILIGLPAGVGVLAYLLTALGSEYEMKMTVGALTYCVSILLTFGVSFLVNFFIARKNRKIDMVEALKGRE